MSQQSEHPDHPDHLDDWAAQAKAVQAIYSDAYAEEYSPLYTLPWPTKHELNNDHLTRILDGLSTPRPRWLDLACGQAWQFSQFVGRADMLGIDLSPAQLERARARVPHATFEQGDMVTMERADGEFDLVTNFWGAYCYLASRERIARLVAKVVRWIRPGGALYFEVLPPKALASFNQSTFAAAMGFVVIPRSEDYTEWGYEDVGGFHQMTSPPLSSFLEIISNEFSHIEAEHHGFMTHLVATGRR